MIHHNTSRHSHFCLPVSSDQMHLHSINSHSHTLTLKDALFIHAWWSNSLPLMCVTTSTQPFITYSGFNLVWILWFLLLCLCLDVVCLIVVFFLWYSVRSVTFSFLSIFLIPISYCVICLFVCFKYVISVVMHWTWGDLGFIMWRQTLRLHWQRVMKGMGRGFTLKANSNNKKKTMLYTSLVEEFNSVIFDTSEMTNCGKVIRLI